MIILEVILQSLLYPFTKSTMALAMAALERGDSDGASRWLNVWRWFRKPIELCALTTGRPSVQPASELCIAWSRWFWRFSWYRTLAVFVVENPFPFTQRPWPAIVRNSLPIYAVEYWWFLRRAQDWASAQDCLRDAKLAGWDVCHFELEFPRLEDANS